MAPTELKFEDTEVEDIEVPTVLELLGNCRATPEVGNMRKKIMEDLTVYVGRLTMIPSFSSPDFVSVFHLGRSAHTSH